MARAERGRPVSVRELDRVVDGLVGEVSQSRARQLRMVVGMWAVALDPGLWPKGRRRPVGAAAGMFVTPVLRAFWDMAVAGQLRTRGDAQARPLSQASQRVVRDCLAILAGRVVPDRQVWLPSVSEQEPKPVVPQAQLAVLYRRLVDMASDAPVERGGVSMSLDDRVRLLAIDRKSTRLNSSHMSISYAVFCL